MNTHALNSPNARGKSFTPSRGNTYGDPCSALLPKTELPSWLIVADEAFVSGYGDANAGEDDSDFDGDDY